jgi:hypothetical protein
VIHAKYLRGRGFFASSGRGVHNFGKGLHRVKHLFKWGAIHIVGRGDQTRFWEDVWIDKVLLRVKYPELFSLCSDPDVLVEEMEEDGECQLEFRRELSDTQIEIWRELNSKLQEVVLVDEDDVVRWAFEKSGHFTATSLYRVLSQGGGGYK